MDLIIEAVSVVVSIVASLWTYCYLKKKFRLKEKKKELQKRRGEREKVKNELEKIKEESQDCHPPKMWEGHKNDYFDERVLKEGIILAQVKYQEYEVKFKKRDLKSLAIMTLCVAVIGFLLTPFLSEWTPKFTLGLALGLGIFMFFRVSVNAAKVLRPKSFESIGSEPGNAIFYGDREREMNLRTLGAYEIILKQTFLDIGEKDEDFEKSIKVLVLGVSILIGIALLAILQKLLFSYCLGGFF